MTREIRTISIALGCAFFAMTSLTASAQSNLVTVRLGVVPAIVSAQAYVAEDLGLFKKQGLDVQFQPMNSGVGTIAALIGGSLDIGFGDGAAVSAAHLRGLPLVFIGPGLMETTQVPLALLVKNDGSVKRPRDLNGKTIAVNAVKSMSTITISAGIDGDGGDSKTVHFIEYPIPQMAAAVESGTAAAALAPEPFITNGVEAGGVRALNLDKGLHNFMLSGWIANTAWISSNRDTVTKFLIAMRQAGDMVNRRPMPAEVADSLSKYTKIPSAVILHMTYPPHDGDVLKVSELQPLIDAAAKYGVIDKSFPATEIMYRRQ